MTGGEYDIRCLLPRLDAALARETQRLRARYQLSLDEFRGLYVSDAQVDARLVEELIFAGPLPDPQESPRWRAMSQRLGLPVLARDLLLLALAPEIDAKYGPIYAYLNDDAARRLPSIDLAMRLFGHNAEERELIRRALEPQGPLLRLNLIEYSHASDKHMPLVLTSFTAQPVLLRWLLGAPAPCPHTRFVDAASTNITPIGDLVPLLSVAARRPLVVLEGQAGAGRGEAAASLARELGLRLLELDLSAVRRAQQPVEHAIKQALLSARLDDAALLVDASEGEADSAARLLAGAVVPTFLSVADATPWKAHLGKLPFVAIKLGTPTAPRRETLWKQALEAEGLHADETSLHHVAARFRLPPGRIRAAAEAVRFARRLPRGADACVAEETLLAAAREQSALDLGTLAVRLPTRAGWHDLVLPLSTYSHIKAFAGAVASRGVVFDQWGFSGVGRGDGGGLVALFGGGSGTGKTMSAAVVAASAGLDIWRIDLSSVVSKYIGETEKNLERIFTAAKTGDAILFFDEADALFGKRSEVKDAHDRYANVEVAFLLQRLEEHNGVVILATNLSRNIDPAFSRRMHYVIDFPVPDAGLREQLWRKAFPHEAPLAEDVDFSMFARRFAFTGGDIRSATLDAAFAAAKAGSSVTMRHLVRAVARQLLKQGKIPVANDFHPFQAYLLDQPSLEAAE